MLKNNMYRRGARCKAPHAAHGSSAWSLRCASAARRRAACSAAVSLRTWPRKEGRQCLVLRLTRRQPAHTRFEPGHTVQTMQPVPGLHVQLNIGPHCSRLELLTT